MMVAFMVHAALVACSAPITAPRGDSKAVATAPAAATPRNARRVTSLLTGNLLLCPAECAGSQAGTIGGLSRLARNHRPDVRQMSQAMTDSSKLRQRVRYATAADG